MVPAVAELLAPASTIDMARVAFEHGADAVYAGASRYTLRAQAPGMEVSGVEELIALARGMSRRVYLALNTMPSDVQMREIEQYLGALAGHGVLPDAFIVSDPGVLALCRRLAPSVALHLSTQTGACNTEALRFWVAQGVGRVVLPREMTLEEIASLTQTGICRTEVFVHGAMCVAVSGRCLLSAYLDGRHANRGDCSQPCRLRYRITPISPQGTPGTRDVEIAEDANGAYLLNSADLCALPVLDRLIAAGVSALKIEGRTKGEHYVAAVTGVYREAVDSCMRDPGHYAVRPEWIEELERLEHHAYTTGFYDGQYRLAQVHAGKRPATARLVGVVKALRRDGAAVIDVRNTFCANEKLLVLARPGAGTSEPVRIDAIRDIDGELLESATANRVVLVQTKTPLHVGDMLRRSV